MDRPNLPDAPDPLPSPLVETLNIVDAMADPALIIGPDYRIVHANPAYQARFGHSERDIRGLPCYQVSHRCSEPCGSPEHPCPLEEVMRTGRPVSVVHTHFTADGTEVLVRVDGTPLRDEQGEITRMLEVIRVIPAQAS